jgi:hypothetical protein
MTIWMKSERRTTVDALAAGPRHRCSAASGFSNAQTALSVAWHPTDAGAEGLEGSSWTFRTIGYLVPVSERRRLCSGWHSRQRPNPATPLT